MALQLSWPSCIIFAHLSPGSVASRRPAAPHKPGERKAVGKQAWTHRSNARECHACRDRTADTTSNKGSAGTRASLSKLKLVYSEGWRSSARMHPASHCCRECWSHGGVFCERPCGDFDASLCLGPGPRGGFGVSAPGILKATWHQGTPADMLGFSLWKPILDMPVTEVEAKSSTAKNKNERLRSECAVCPCSIRRSVAYVGNLSTMQPS